MFIVKRIVAITNRKNSGITPRAWDFAARPLARISMLASEIRGWSMISDIPRKIIVNMLISCPDISHVDM